MSTSGAPFTKQRTTSRPLRSVMRWNVAMNLYSESNGTSATRGVARTGPVEVDPALGRQHDQRTLGRVADQVARLVEAGVRAQRHRQERVVEVDRETPSCLISPVVA